ncbi:hypothetical protein VPHK567_0231 [Vibrio phage K567]
MFYRFWETDDGDMLVEMLDDLCDEVGTKAYMTDMNEVYRTESGRHMLLQHVHNWGTVDFQDWDIRTLRGLGSSIEMPSLTLSPSDKSVLERTVKKEGLDYAMLHYSKYDGDVGFNKVDSNEFHGLRNAFVDARQQLQSWLALNGITE